MNNDNKLGYLAVILSNIIIGLAFLFTKKAVTATDPITTLFLRFFICFIVISLTILFKIVKVNLKGKNLKNLIFMSIFFPSGFFLFQSFGLKYASSSEAGIISALTPAIILILSIVFLKEKTNIKQILSIILSIFGVIYIFSMKGMSLNLDNFLGILLIFISCICFSIFSILSRKFSNEFTPVEICFFMQLFGFMVFLFLFIVNRNSFSSAVSLFKDLSFIGPILYLSVLSTLISAILNNYALSKIEASKVGVFFNISTIVSIAAGALILNEKIFYYHIIGCTLIIIGIVGANYFSPNIDTKNTSKKSA
ncbi:DMT family transporter [Tepidibacter aestuarii]|uniref:DMT family transporter n=1 Tax=Tepidibacter aestuarii TaxID=2925782 RepID=UPI0020C11465|nr:DMT family transporter [Tepidibacter aestuarii]CAH2212127.1 Permease of the drug/metabolite transporter (DMT) superfamily [Tepidibacter aestuarii]